MAVSPDRSGRCSRSRLAGSCSLKPKTCFCVPTVTHPELVIAAVNVASSDWAGSRLALAIERGSAGRGGDFGGHRAAARAGVAAAFHLAWLKSEAAANEEDKPLQIAECENAISQSNAILARLGESPSPTPTEPPDLHDPAVIAGLAETFYLSEFVNTPTAQRIAAAIQTRYQHNADEEWPDAYYDDLTAAYDRLLRCALELNEPVKAAA